MPDELDWSGRPRKPLGDQTIAEVSIPMGYIHFLLRGVALIWAITGIVGLCRFDLKLGQVSFSLAAGLLYIDYRLIELRIKLHNRESGQS